MTRPSQDIRRAARTAKSPRGARSASCALLVVLFLGGSCTRERAETTRDDLNRPVVLPPRITRIVTLAPNLTEIVFAIGAGHKVAGTDDHSNEPAAARRLAKVGGMQPDIERIVSLHPDLVLASTSGNHPNLAPALAAAGVPLYVVKTDRLAEIPAAMTRLGEILGATDATLAARRVRNAIATQRRVRARTPRVLFAVWTDPLYVAGRKTFSDDLLALAGARNVVEAGGWPQYSLESLVASPPDVIFYPDRSVSREQAERLLARAPVLRDRVTLFAIDEDRSTRPGPRVAEAAAQLNRLLDEWENAHR